MTPDIDKVTNFKPAIKNRSVSFANGNSIDVIGEGQLGNIMVSGIFRIY